MPTDVDLTTNDVFLIADEMMEAATKAFHKRRNSPRIRSKDYEDLMRQEIALRYDSDRYRAVGIRLLASDGTVTANILIQQLKETNTALAAINKLRNFINMLSVLVDFGAAIASGNIQAIIAANDKLNKIKEAEKKRGQS